MDSIEIMDFTPEEQKIVDKYLDNNMYELEKIISKLINKKKAPQMYDDDLHDVATKTFFESVKSYDESKGCKFKAYLTRCIWKSFYDWTRDNFYRAKRSNLQVDKDGKIMKDEKGKPIIVQGISLDEKVEDDLEWSEKIASDFNIEEELSEKMCLSSDERVDEFLGKLSSIQREIVSLLMFEYKPNEIREKLCISTKEYNEAMKMIKQNKHLSAFNKNSRETKRKAVVGNMEETKVFEVMEIDTTDSYRMDKYSLLSLLNKKTDGEIDCNYISQRAPFQWQPMQINKFYTRILNNQPIPEIIICETVEDGEKVAYLIDGLQRLSYAEWFKENRIKIGDKGAEFTKIKYRKYELDENGNKIMDEKGRAKYEIDTFDVSGKYYKDLPEFLQKRFDNFNINVTTFFNCTEEIIDYHIRNYNNHVAMSKSQYGITNVSNFTSRNIKLISEEHDFFKDIVKCTSSNKTKGTLEEVVARSIMTLNFINDWKRDLLDALLYIDENANDEHYKKFRELLDRLYKAGCTSVKDMFTTTNAHIWFAIYDKFTKLGIDDSKFVKFMEKFIESMKAIDKAKKDGEEYIDSLIDNNTYEVFKRRNTKDKSTVVDKIESVYALLLSYLHINIEETQSEETENILDTVENNEVSTLDFIKENVSEDTTEEDLQCYEEVLDDLTLEVDNNTPLLDEQNIKSLLALVAYSFQNDIDLDKWLPDYFNRVHTYNRNSKENYLLMIHDLNKFLKKGAMA